MIAMDGDAAHAPPRSRYLAALAFALLGLAASLAAYVFVQRADQRAMESDFANRADNYQLGLQFGIDSYLQTLRAFAGYFRADEEVSRDEFQAVTRLQTTLPGSSNIGWFPRVTRSERAAFEARARAEGLANYYIKDEVQTPNPPPAPQRDEYFPLTFGTDHQTLPRAYGYDVPSGPLRPFFERARKTGMEVATTLLPLAATGGTQRAIIVIEPIFRAVDSAASNGSGRAGEFLGFVTGLFPIAQTIEGILSATSAPGGANLYFFDPKAEPGNRLVYQHVSRLGGGSPAPPDEAGLRTGLFWQGTIKVADREWAMLAKPIVPFSGARDWTALGILASGLVLTLMVAGFFAITARRSALLAALNQRLEGSTRDLTAEVERRVAADRQVVRYDAIVRAVAAASKDLVERRGRELPFAKVLERVAVAAEADRAYILGDRRMEGGVPAATLRVEWSAFGFAEPPGGSISRVLDARKAGLTRWAIRLRDGHALAALTADLPAEERKIINPANLRAFAIAPIFVEDAWWGEIGLVQQESDHAWTAAEVDALRALADVIGATIERARDVTTLLDADAIIRHSPVILYRLAPEPPFRMTYVSSNVVQLGYRAATLLASPNLRNSLFHPDDLPQITACLERFGAEWAKLAKMLWRFRKEDGDFRWFENQLIPIRDNDGGLEAIAGIAVDVTERKLVEEKLAFSNLLLRTSTETSPDGILVVDADGKIISFNTRFVQLFDIPRDLLEAAGDEAVLQKVASQVRDERGFMARVRYLYDHPEERGHEDIPLKDGRVVDRYSGSLFEKDGRYLGRIWFFRDVTARKAAEEKLQLANALLSTQIENLPDGVLVVDAQRRIVSFNQKFIELWRVPPEIVASRSDERAVAFALSEIENSEEFHKRLEAIYANPAERVHDEINLRDGRVIERYSSSIPLAAGGPPARIFFFRDISERKRAEKAALASNALAKAIVTSTKELLATSAPDRSIPIALNRIGAVLEEHRIIVVAHDTAPDGRPRCTARFEWKGGDTPGGDLAALFDEFRPDLPDMAEWYAPLAQGAAVFTTPETANPTAKQILARLGVESLLFVPIIVVGAYWGHLALEGRLAGRRWSPFEIELFRMLADLIGAALARDADASGSAAHQAPAPALQAKPAA